MQRGGLRCLGPKQRGWRGLGRDAAPPAATLWGVLPAARTLSHSRPGGGGRPAARGLRTWRTWRGGAGARSGREQDAFSSAFPAPQTPPPGAPFEIRGFWGGLDGAERYSTHGDLKRRNDGSICVCVGERGGWTQTFQGLAFWRGEVGITKPALEDRSYSAVPPSLSKGAPPRDWALAPGPVAILVPGGPGPLRFPQGWGLSWTSP